MQHMNCPGSPVTRCNLQTVLFNNTSGFDFLCQTIGVLVLEKFYVFLHLSRGLITVEIIAAYFLR